MLKSSPRHVARLLVLSAAAAVVLGAPVVVLAESQAGSPAKATSAPTADSKQGKSDAERQSEMNEHFQKLSQRLKLTDDQIPKVKSIMLTKMSQVSELREKYKGLPATADNKVAMEKSHQELQADTEAQLSKVLTADQMTEFRKLQAERMKKHEAREQKETAAEGKK